VRLESNIVIINDILNKNITTHPVSKQNPEGYIDDLEDIITLYY